jgi:hypothetical protein
MKLIRHISLLIVAVAMLALPVAASANGDDHPRHHHSVIADPTVAPTVAVGDGTSSLAAGTYAVGYAWRENGGTTLLSPIAALTLAAGQTIAVTLPAFPADVSSADIYLSVAPNSNTLAFAANTTSGMTTLSALPVNDAAAPPTVNTTGVVNGDEDDNELDTETHNDHSSSNDANVQHHDGEWDHHNGGGD